MPCPGNTVGDCYAATWAQRVINNGGARPSQDTLDAAGIFYNALETAGILSKMIAVNMIAPDSLTAAITPLIVGPGLDPWTNNGPFIAGDITVNGIIGNGSTKYLNTGLVPNTAFPSDADGGITAYCFDAPTGSGQCYMGAKNAANSTQALLDTFGGGMFWDSWNFTTGRVTTASQGAGYYSGSRTAANSSNLYFAKSSTAHSSIASVATSGGTRPDRQMYAMALTEFNGSAVFLVSTRVSFLAAHRGLTSVESSDFFNAIQALRTAFGGGFV